MIKCIYMKLKLFKVGNSYCVRIPKKIAEPFIGGEVEVAFPVEIPVKREVVPAPEKIKKTLPDVVENVITQKVKNNGGSEFCKKHIGSRKWTCGCK